MTKSTTLSALVAWTLWVLVACVQLALTAPALAQPTASDFTVTAPYGSTRIDYSFVGHAAGGSYQPDRFDIFQFGGHKALTKSADPAAFYLEFPNPGFVRGGTVQYGTCTSELQCTGADRAEATITFVPTGAPTPVVTSVAVPANGTYKAGNPLYFTVNFDLPVAVTGTPQIALTVGGAPRIANYVSGSGSSALVFSHTVQAGDMAPSGIAITGLSANGGTIRTAATVDANLALNDIGNTSGVLIDTASPQVQAVSVVGSPAPNATEITLEIVFSKPVSGFSLWNVIPLAPVGTTTLSNLRTDDNTTYQLDFGMTAPGNYGIGIPAGAVSDAAGNSNAAYTNNAVWVRKSGDASLSSLVSSAGALSPVFATGTLNYTLAVDHDTDTIMLTPLVSNSSATVTVNGQAVAAGSASPLLALAVGPNAVAIVVTAPDGTSTQTYTVTVTRAAALRPDPSRDPEVIGLLNAQADTATRLAQNQMLNFHGRLEQLHNEGDRRASSLDVRLALQIPSSSPALQELERMTGASGSGQAGDMPGLLAYGASEAEPMAAGSAPLLVPDFGPLAVWTGGFVNFGARNGGGIDLDYTMAGVSGGVDYRFSESFVGGFGVGYGRDHTDIGSNGTQSRANAFSAAVYGSYNPADNLFIDGLLGGSWLDFASRRFITASGDFATGNRSGKQLFGALTTSYEFRDTHWLVSPYGRIELSRSWLDGFTETGGGGHGLSYGDQAIDTLSSAIGVRASYAFEMEWGVLTPGIRAEYTHDFAGSSRASLGYTDSGGLPFAIDVDPSVRDFATLGLSLDMQFDNAANLRLDYGTSFGGSGNHDHRFGARLGMKF